MKEKNRTLSCLLRTCQVPRPKVIAPGKKSNHFDNLEPLSFSENKRNHLELP
jgi:hypothetical protein